MLIYCCALYGYIYNSTKRARFRKMKGLHERKSFGLAKQKRKRSLGRKRSEGKGARHREGKERKRCQAPFPLPGDFSFSPLLQRLIQQHVSQGFAYAALHQDLDLVNAVKLLQRLDNRAQGHQLAGAAAGMVVQEFLGEVHGANTA